MRKHKLAGSLLASLLLLSSLNGSVKAEKKTESPIRATSNKRIVQKNNLLDTLASIGSFTTFLKAVNVAGLADTLQNDAQYTLLAPSDEAFAKLPPETLKILMSDQAKLSSVLAYHLLPGKIASKDLMTLNSIKTVNGKPLIIEIDDGKVEFNKTATLQKVDIASSNGIIHTVNEVIIPPDDKDEV